MTLPVYLHSGMMGAPVHLPSAGEVNALLNACLVNGFNTQSVVSATASGGVVTFNFASAPGFSAADTVTIAGASNATVNGQRRVQSAASNQVLVVIPGVPDGVVGGTITLKFSPLGWTRPFSGTNVAAYQQGGASVTNRYLRVVDDVLGRFNARGYEAMSDVNTGTGPFPTVAQEADADGKPFYRGSSYLTNPRPWVIVGTPRFFYLMWGTYNSYSGGYTSLVTSDTYSFFFGELADIGKPGDAFAHVIQRSYNDVSCWVARSHNESAECEANVYGVGTNNLCLPNTYPDLASGGVQLVAGAAVREVSPSPGYRGRYPGILSALQNILTSPTTGIPGGILTGVEGVIGRVLCFTNMGTSTSSNGVLLLDEDWGDA